MVVDSSPQAELARQQDVVLIFQSQRERIRRICLKRWIAIDCIEVGQEGQMAIWPT